MKQNCKLGDMGVNGSCTKKSSSFDNWKTMYKIPDLKNTNCMGNINPQFEKTELDKPVDRTQYFFDKFYLYLMEKYKDKSFLSHARSVTKIAQKLAINNKSNFLSIAIESQFVNSILQELAKRKSLKVKKIILKKLYLYYFDHHGYNLLDPIRVQVIRQIDTFRFKKATRNYSKSDAHPLVEEFLEYLTEKNFKWQRHARYSLGVFIGWMAEKEQVSVNDINARDISAEVLFAFKKHLESRVYYKQITVGTAQNYIKAIRRWLQFLKLKGYIINNPSVRLKNFTVSRKKEFRLLSLEEVARFYIAILDSGRDVLRDFSLFATIGGLGVRATEALNSDVSDVNLKDGEIKIVRKGGKEQLLPLPSISWLLLEKYLQSRPGLEDMSPIWINDAGNRLPYQSAWHKFHFYMRKAGLHDKVGACHFFRHLLLSELALEGFQLNDIKDLAGHASLHQTGVYLRARLEQVKENFINKYKAIGGDLYYGN